MGFLFLTKGDRKWKVERSKTLIAKGREKKLKEQCCQID